MLTLAIGLGANTALFGVFSAALRPVAVPNADRLVTIAADVKGDDTGGFQYTFSRPALEDLQRRADGFDAIVGMIPRVTGLAADRRVSQFWFAAVSDNYFFGLGVPPGLGAYFDSAAGSPVRVVLGHAFWKNAFGGDPGVIGKAVRVEGEPAVVIGVVPESFRGTLMAVELDGYVALDDYPVLMRGADQWFHSRTSRPIQLFGMLAHGVELREAQASIDAVMTTLEREYPDTDRGISARVTPELLSRPLPMRTVSEVLPRVRFLGMALAGLVLLLACMNVANLLLVRATAREREMAVRAALGASRLRLIRLMVTEGVVLSILGGMTGLLMGQWVTTAFLVNLDVGSNIPIRIDPEFDGRVFLFALTAAILTGLLVGLWPAWRVSRADARGALHDGGRGGSDSRDRQRVRRLFVVAQIAGSVVLLSVAGLFVRSLWSAERIDLGFDAAHLITVRLDPRQIGYDDTQARVFYDDLHRRLRGIAGVQSVAMAGHVPMSYLVGGGSIFVEGRPDVGGQPPAYFMNRVGQGYFDTMGISIVRGRAFDERDEPETPLGRRVAIVNESMAHLFWSGEDPIGKRLRVYQPDNPLLEVVGVARDSKYVLIFERPSPFVYLPIDRQSTLRAMHVRASGDPAALAPAIEREIRALAPDLPIADLQTMRQSLAGLFGFLIFRIGSLQAGGLGLLGMILALIGVYGVVAFGASLRTREMGIRMALGAQTQDVMRLILGQGALLVVMGLFIGVTIAVGLGILLARNVPVVNGSDWQTFAVVSVGLAALALWACYLPARRASRVPVTTALRHE